MSETVKVLRLDLKHCSVKGCNHNTVTNRGMCFHKIPPPNKRLVSICDYFGNKRQVDQHEAWKTILKIENVTNSTRVCSDHFTKDDYIFPDIPTQLRRLKRTAVPNCKLPNSNQASIKRNAERLERRERRNSIAKRTFQVRNDKEYNCLHGTSIAEIYKEHSYSQGINSMEFDNLTDDNNISGEHSNNHSDKCTTNGGNECVCNLIQCYCKEKGILSSTNKVSEKILEKESENDSIVHDLLIMEPVSAATESKENNQDGIDITGVKLSTKNVGVQINTEYRFFQLIKTKEQLSTGTGIESFEILKVIIENVKVISKNKYENERFEMKTEDRVLMTYVKLKQNLSYSFLALIFNSITPSHCRTIFLETVRILSKCFKEAISWPSKEEISKNILEYIQALNHSAQISKARVHVDERFNQRIKAFKIINSAIPKSLVPCIEDIFIVICGTVNLSAPIIGNDTFIHEKMDATQT